MVLKERPPKSIGGHVCSTKGCKQRLSVLLTQFAQREPEYLFHHALACHVGLYRYRVGLYELVHEERVQVIVDLQGLAHISCQGGMGHVDHFLGEHIAGDTDDTLRTAGDHGQGQGIVP